jgi:hypothetical protein
MDILGRSVPPEIPPLRMEGLPSPHAGASPREGTPRDGTPRDIDMGDTTPRRDAHHPSSATGSARIERHHQAAVDEAEIYDDRHNAQVSVQTHDPHNIPPVTRPVPTSPIQNADAAAIRNHFAVNVPDLAAMFGSPRGVTPRSPAGYPQASTMPWTPRGGDATGVADVQRQHSTSPGPVAYASRQHSAPKDDTPRRRVPPQAPYPGARDPVAPQSHLLEQLYGRATREQQDVYGRATREQQQQQDDPLLPSYKLEAAVAQARSVERESTPRDYYPEDRSLTPRDYSKAPSAQTTPRQSTPPQSTHAFTANPYARPQGPTPGSMTQRIFGKESPGPLTTPQPTKRPTPTPNPASAASGSGSISARSRYGYDRSSVRSAATTPRDLTKPTESSQRRTGMAVEAPQSARARLGGRPPVPQATTPRQNVAPLSARSDRGPTTGRPLSASHSPGSTLSPRDPLRGPTGPSGHPGAGTGPGAGVAAASAAGGAPSRLAWNAWAPSAARTRLAAR